MVLDVVIKTEIAVLAPGIVDRMSMHLVHFIGVDEAVLIECDQRNEGATEKA